jgi:dihydrodipicolinate synthase/N-acetylneuraminate lyase
MTDASLLQGSIVALLTPMTADEKIDFPALERLIDLHVDAGTSAIVVASTTGEGPTLTFKADTNPLPAKWLAHRIGWVNATLRLPLVIPPELSRRLSGSDALIACAALLGH